MPSLRAPLLLLVCACAFEGRITTPPLPTGPDGPNPDPLAGPPLEAPYVGPLYGLHLLTRDELNATLTDLLGITEPLADGLLPENMAKPFTHDLVNLTPSTPVVFGLSQLAADAARLAVTTPALKARLVSCATQNAACLDTFVSTFGRRAFRRPLTTAETTELGTLARTVLMQATFDVALEVVLRALLQSPSFLYRREVGTTALDAWDVATRLSYGLWGTTPDDSLLAMAAAGSILSADARRAMAEAMLSDPRAARRLLQFHAEWLGYARMQHDPMTALAYRAETDALVTKQLVRERQPWPSLLQLDSAPGVAALSTVYGVTLPDDLSVFTPLPPERRGLFTRAAFLSNGAKAGDTSPTNRGKFIRERLLCQTISPPPPGVEADVPPPIDSGACKVDRYVAHRTIASCAGCHSQMDPVGFGLENFDRLGRWRTVELQPDGQPSSCVISGEGEVKGIGTFTGGAALGDLLLDQDRLEGCMIRQYLKFSLGRKLLADEQPLLDGVLASYQAGGRTMQAVLLGWVGSDDFVLSRAEGAGP